MRIALFLFLLISSSFLISCADDDDNGNVIGNVTETNSFILRSSIDGTSIGEVILENMGDNTVTVQIIIEEPDFEIPLEVHLHSGTAAETGPVLLTLNDLDPETGISTTNFSSWNDGTEAIYEQLMIIDAYIDLHNPEQEIFYAFTDIGMNELTGTSQIYNLTPENNSGIEGSINFEKRMDNTTLATLNVENMSASAQYSAFIYADNALEGEEMLFGLGEVEELSLNMNQIEIFADGTEITFDGLMNFDGHIRLFETVNGVQTLIASADIGTNAFTESIQHYTVEEENGSGINGVLTANERISGEVVFTIELEGTDPQENYSAFIFSGTVDNEEETVLLTLNTVSGSSGTSKTNISVLDDETELNFNMMVGMDAHIRIYSIDDNTLVAEGNIGINAE